MSRTEIPGTSETSSSQETPGVAETSSTTSLRVTLLHQSVLERVSGDLITQARQLLEQYDERLKKEGMEEHQLRNVLDVSLRAGHYTVVTAFIHYQTGRSEGRNPWKKSGFGEALRKTIESSLPALLNKNDYRSDSERDQLVLLLTRHLLGWLSRLFVAYRYAAPREDRHGR